MKLEKEFVLARRREELVGAFDDDAIYESLFPDTRVTSGGQGVRETRTPYAALGQSRELRLLFRTLPDGNVSFEKICDGNVWRSLEGELRLEPRGDRTRVVLRMEGRTRALVPELAIRGPLRQQLEQMAESLRKQLRSW